VIAILCPVVDHRLRLPSRWCSPPRPAPAPIHTPPPPPHYDTTASPTPPPLPATYQLPPPFPSPVAHLISYTPHFTYDLPHGPPFIPFTHCLFATITPHTTTLVVTFASDSYIYLVTICRYRTVCCCWLLLPFVLRLFIYAFDSFR